MQNLYVHKVFTELGPDPSSQDCKHLVRSKLWNQPWALPDLNPIKALQADQMGGERERGKKLVQIPNIV